MWRQGDIYIQKIENIPEDAALRGGCVLARGEATGHAHQVLDLNTAELYENDGTLYLRVKAEQAVLTHEEHKSITLPTGSYRVWRQREYVPTPLKSTQEESFRYVRD